MYGGYSDFQTLAYSRHSVRDFSDKPLSVEKIKKAVKLAQTACNRQSSRIIHVTDREKCEKILNIQGGAKGHSITELLLLVSDLSLYRFLSEMDTLYLDSGIFLMNLLYSCTYYEIDTCPLIWDDYGEKGTELRRILPIGKNMHVIAVIQIGEHRENSVHAISHRRPVEDVFIEM